MLNLFQNLEFLPEIWVLLNLLVCKKNMISDKGGGGVSQFLIISDKGGRGGMPISDFWLTRGEGGVWTPHFWLT